MTEQLQDFHPSTVDVGAQRVAQIYAEALLNAAEKKGQVESILEELDSLIRDLFGTDPQFEAFLSSGAIGRDQKAKVLRSAFENRASELFANFLLVLNHHERLDLLRPILTAARELYDQRSRRLRVQVRSAVPLPDDQRDRLMHELRQTFHLEPVLQAQVDPDLLGGMVVRVGDWVYDTSVRTQLETIRNQLIARSSYEIQSRRDRFSSTNGN
jgi:F-type H+-transporting ATPase subunit delta